MSQLIEQDAIDKPDAGSSVQRSPGTAERPGHHGTSVFSSDARSALLTYGVAIATVAAMLLLRWSLDPWLGDRRPLETLYGAIAIAVWYGGYRPALLAVALGYLGGDYFFVEPRGYLDVPNASALIGLIAYGISSVIIIAFGEAMHHARRAAEASRRDALKKREQSSRVEARLAAIVESADDAIISKNLAGIIQSWNSSAERMFGYSGHETIGRPISFLIPHDRPDEEAHIIKRILRGEPVNHFETVRLRKDGSVVEVSLGVSPIKDRKGAIVGASTVIRDISERLRADEALRSSEERYRTVVETANEGIWVIDRGARTQLANRRLSEILGCTVEEVCNRTVLDFVFPEDRAAIQQRIDANLNGFTEQFDFRFRRLDGTQRQLLGCTSPIKDYAGRVVGALGMFTDITPRKQAEQALRESEERWRLSMAALFEGTLILGPDGRIRACNPAAQRVLGLPDEQIVGRTAMDTRWHAVREDETPFPNEELPSQVALRTGEAVAGVIMGISRPDGQRVWLEVNSNPMIAPGEKKPYAAVTSFKDITDSRRAREAIAGLNRDLKRRVEELQTLLDTAPIGILVASDTACGDIRVNDAGAGMLGIARDENVSKTGAGAASLPFKLTSAGRELAATELPMQYAANHNIELRDVPIDVVRADGTTVSTLLNASPVRDESGAVRGVIGVMVDLTERRRAEEELIKAQKLESIGVLAGGIAHDFNNILTALFGNVELAKLHAESDQVREPLIHAERAFKRARDLTQRLLTFARGGAPIRKMVAVEDLLRESAAFALHGSNVDIEFGIQPGLWSAHLDEGQIGQAIHNLVINAKEAMPRGGRLLVQAHNATLEEGNPMGLSAGRYLEVRIKDWGVGIAAENIKKVFDPYFTTKPKGTGLGLSAVYSIVTRHGGHIGAQSKEGKGATFTIYLPASETTAANEKADRQALTQGKGRILLMDDEVDVQRVAKAMLSQLGYEVEVASDGQEAIERYQAAKNRGDPFAVVILDLTVPGKMGGTECLHHLKAIDPDVKAVVASGYSNDPAISGHRGYGFLAAIPKPFLLSDLSSVLQALQITAPIASA